MNWTTDGWLNKNRWSCLCFGGNKPPVGTWCCSAPASWEAGIILIHYYSIFCSQSFVLHSHREHIFLIFALQEWGFCKQRLSWLNIPAFFPCCPNICISSNLGSFQLTFIPDNTLEILSFIVLDICPNFTKLNLYFCLQLHLVTFLRYWG